MRVVVTGGAGYLGSCVVRQLLEHKHDVRVVDTLLHGGRSLLEIFHQPRLQVVRCDIRDTHHLPAALKDAEAVIHLAAIVGDAAAARDATSTREVNHTASMQLFEQAARAGAKRFLFASTCSNYGKGLDADGYFHESSPLTPLSLYAETKVEVERHLLAHPRPGVRVSIMRFATLFGLSPRPRLDLTVNDFTVQLFIKNKLEIYDESFWRPYLHVRDAARAVHELLKSKAPASPVADVWNVGDTRLNYQKRQIAEKIHALLGNTAEIMLVKKGSDPRDYRVSFDKIKREIGYCANQTLADGIRELIAALQLKMLSNPESPIYRN